MELEELLRFKEKKQPLTQAQIQKKQNRKNQLHSNLQPTENTNVNQNNSQNQKTEIPIPKSVEELKAKALSGTVSPDDIKNLLLNKDTAQEFIKWMSEKGYKDGNGLTLTAQSLQNASNNPNTNTDNGTSDNNAIQNNQTNGETIQNSVNQDTTSQIPLDSKNHPKFQQFGKFLNPIGNRIKTKTDMESVAQYFHQRAEKMAQ